MQDETPTNGTSGDDNVVQLMPQTIPPKPSSSPEKPAPKAKAAAPDDKERKEIAATIVAMAKRLQAMDDRQRESEKRVIGFEKTVLEALHKHTDRLIALDELLTTTAGVETETLAELKADLRKMGKAAENHASEAQKVVEQGKQAMRLLVAAPAKRSASSGLGLANAGPSAWWVLAVVATVVLALGYLMFR